jgi:hypothetical protein
MPPYETGGSRNHKLYFCYYYKWTNVSS